MLLRALLAFIALPGLVAFVAPLLLAWPRVRSGPFNAIALVLLIPGVTLLLWCVRDFLVIGKGTLAPWDPPRSLVSSGPYRFSRNPMYVGVSLMLLGWAMAFRSSGLLLYTLIVMLAFHLRVVFGEEPWLARTHQRKWNEYPLAGAAMDVSKPARDRVLVGWSRGGTRDCRSDVRGVRRGRSGARVSDARDDGGHRRTTAAPGVHRP